jgi:hypothetical protein
MMCGETKLSLDPARENFQIRQACLSVFAKHRDKGDLSLLWVGLFSNRRTDLKQSTGHNFSEGSSTGPVTCRKLVTSSKPCPV